MNLKCHLIDTLTDNLSLKTFCPSKGIEVLMTNFVIGPCLMCNNRLGIRIQEHYGFVHAFCVYKRDWTNTLTSNGSKAWNNELQVRITGGLGWLHPFGYG